MGEVQVPPEELSAGSHGLNMQSAYTPDDEEFSFSLRGSLGFCGMLDQIWYETSALHCVSVRALFRSREHRTAVLQRGLPGEGDPSDHLPVGALFGLHRSAAASSLIGPRKLVQAPPVEDVSPEELFAEAALLF